MLALPAELLSPNQVYLLFVRVALPRELVWKKLRLPALTVIVAVPAELALPKLMPPSALLRLIVALPAELVSLKLRET